MTSKTRNDVRNTSWCQEVHHDVQNTSWRQKNRHDVMTSKKCVMASKTRHDVKQCAMASKTRHDVQNTSWRHRMRHDVKNTCDVKKGVISSKTRHDVIECVMTSKTRVTLKRASFRPKHVMNSTNLSWRHLTLPLPSVPSSPVLPPPLLALYIFDYVLPTPSKVCPMLYKSIVYSDIYDLWEPITIVIFNESLQTFCNSGYKK